MQTLATYRRLLGRPQALRLTLGGAVLRLGHASSALAVLLTVRHATGSFALAGMAVGVEAACAAASPLWQGRLMDRRGIARVLVPVAIANGLATAALAVAALAGAGAGVLIALVALTGVLMPAATAGMRAMWTEVAGEERGTAFALDTTIQELAFISGPSAVGAISAFVAPALALVGCGALVAAGTLAIAAAPAARGAVAAARHEVGSVGLARALAAVVAAALTIGAAVGVLEVAAPAFASEHGHMALAGVLVGALSLGSLVGGLWYGGRSWRSAASTRLVAALAVLACGMALLPVAGSVAALVPLLALAGLPLSAAISTLFLVVDERAPRHRVTEAFGWTGAALPGGSAVGSAAAGWIVAGPGTGWAFALAAAFAAIGALAGAGALVRRARSRVAAAA